MKDFFFIKTAPPQSGVQTPYYSDFFCSPVVEKRRNEHSFSLRQIFKNPFFPLYQKNVYPISL